MVQKGSSPHRMRKLNFSDFFQDCSSNASKEHYTKIAFDEIESSEFDVSSIEVFQILYTQCFDLHLSSNPFFVSTKTIKPALNVAKEIFESEQITNLFLSSYYKYPAIETLSYDQYNQSYSNIKNIKEEQVKDEILSDISSSGKIIFLTGDVGEGKSSLLHRFCIDATEIKGEDKWEYFPVLIDVQRIIKKHKNDIDTELFYSLILEHIIQIIEKKYRLAEVEKETIVEETTHKNSLTVSARLVLKAMIASIMASSRSESIEKKEQKTISESVRKFDTPLSKIQQLATTLNNNHVRLILLIDNLDTFSYSDERYMLFPNGFKIFQNNVSKAQDIVNQIILSLSESPISYIFTLRPYVLSHIFNTTSENSLDISIATRTKIYKINFNYMDDSKDIFISRITLLNDLCELIQKSNVIAAKKKENILRISEFYREKTQSLLMQTDKISKIFSEFYDIANQGYRSIVLFYKNLKYNPRLFDRYFTYDALHLYKLDFFQRYSQILPSTQEYNHTFKSKNYHYPNIFLVVCDAHCNRSCHDNYASKPNQFTYWLKYIILLHLYKNKNITLKKLVDSFYSKREGYYEEHAVKLAIGSLGTINEYNCLKYNFDSDKFTSLDNMMSSTNVELTNRASKIIEKNNAFAFYNLEYFVDDWLLPKPKIDKFGIDLSINNSETYEYLLKTEGYSKNLSKVTLQKTKEIILFLYYLEYSFKYEKVKYKNVWAPLEKEYEGKFIFEQDFFVRRRSEILNFANNLFCQHPHGRQHLYGKQNMNDINIFNRKCKNYEADIDRFFKKVYSASMEVVCSSATRR